MYLDFIQVLAITIFFSSVFYALIVNSHIELSTFNLILFLTVLSIPINIPLYLFSNFTLDKYILGILYTIHNLPLIIILSTLINTEQIRKYNYINSINKFKNHFKLLVFIALITLIEMELDLQSFSYLGIYNVAVMIWEQYQSLYLVNIAYLIPLILLVMIAKYNFKFNYNFNVSLTSPYHFSWGSKLSTLFLTFYILAILVFVLKNIHYAELHLNESLLSISFTFIFYCAITLGIVVFNRFNIYSQSLVIFYTIPVFITSLYLINLINYINIFILIAFAFLIKYSGYYYVANKTLINAKKSVLRYNFLTDKFNFIFIIPAIMLLTEMLKDQTITFILAPQNAEKYFIVNTINDMVIQYDIQYVSPYILIYILTIIVLNIGITNVYNKIQ